VPLEGQWQRLNTPVRRLTARERGVVRVALVIVVVTTIAIVILALSTSTAPPRPGCIDAIVPGAMGGQPVTGCGARARAICLARAGQSDPGSLAVLRSCRRAGIAD
jgi:hypothetical protein